jgi:hypothetical protein
VSASKLDGSNADSGERKKPGTSKGAARALPASPEKTQIEKLPGITQELQAGLTLPDPAERRKILERAGLLIAEARALLDRLDDAEKKAAAMISADTLKARPTRSKDAES